MHTEDARRIILRAANAGPRSPQKGGIGSSGGGQMPHIVNIVGSRVSASAATPSAATTSNEIVIGQGATGHGANKVVIGNG